jgi:hypothetical protein
LLIVVLLIHKERMKEKTGTPEGVWSAGASAEADCIGQHDYPDPGSGFLLAFFLLSKRTKDEGRKTKVDIRFSDTGHY